MRRSILLKWNVPYPLPSQVFIKEIWKNRFQPESFLHRTVVCYGYIIDIKTSMEGCLVGFMVDEGLQNCGLPESNTAYLKLKDVSANAAEWAFHGRNEPVIIIGEITEVSTEVIPVIKVTHLFWSLTREIFDEILPYLKTTDGRIE